MKTVMETSDRFIGRLNEFLKMYNDIFKYIAAFSAITSLFIMIYHLISLYFVSDNPNERRRLIKNCLISGLCFSAFGSIATIMFIFRGFTIGLLA